MRCVAGAVWGRGGAGGGSGDGGDWSGAFFCWSRFSDVTTRSSRMMSTFTVSTMNQGIVDAKYAVRGPIVARAAEHEHALARGEPRPFKEVIYCNIGNPQKLDQKPISFVRQVLALCDYPQLMDDPRAVAHFPADAVARAKKYLAEAGNVGAYSDSVGLAGVRREVADFIAQRDGFPADPDNVFLTGGASPAVHMLIRAMTRTKNDAHMIPIPQVLSFSPRFWARAHVCISLLVSPLLGVYYFVWWHAGRLLPRRGHGVVSADPRAAEELE